MTTPADAGPSHDGPADTDPSDTDIVFNVVWTGEVFTHLRYFIESQFAHSGARYRFLVNDCPPAQVATIEDFARHHPDRVVEVLDATPGQGMIGHGKVLDAVLAMRDDGDYFGLIDPDIIASGPFLDDFRKVVDAGACAVSSGRGVWTETVVLPEGHPGVNGEYFYNADGFLFGGPHFTIYRRDALDETMTRWNLGFGEGGNGLSELAKATMAEAGLDYWIFDTGKLVNIFLQLDGGDMQHFEHDSLMHIGGISHFLSPPKYIQRDADSEPEPDWAVMPGMESRYAVAHYTGTVLRELCRGAEAPLIPADVDPILRPKLDEVRAALIDLLDRFGDQRSA